MNKSQTQVLQWARRLRDFAVAHDIKSDVAELTSMRQELDDTLAQLTADAAAQEAITRQSRVQTTEIKRLRKTLRESQMKPIVRMSRTMKLQINGSDITFVLPPQTINSERLAAAADAMVTALKTLGPHFVAKGIAANFVDQLTATTKALRSAIDQRAALFGQRIGTTAAMQAHEDHVVQIVRVLDTIIRPVIQNDAELLATWNSLLALPRPAKQAVGVVVKPAGSGSAAGGTSPAPTTSPASSAGTATSTTAAVAPSSVAPVSTAPAA